MEQRFKIVVVVEQSLLPALIEILSDKKITIQTITIEECPPIQRKRQKRSEKVDSTNNKNIHLTQYEENIIEFLTAYQGDGLTSVEVAERFNRNKASTSSILSKLFATGIVQRKQSRDKSTVYIYYIPKATASTVNNPRKG